MRTIMIMVAMLAIGCVPGGGGGGGGGGGVCEIPTCADGHLGVWVLTVSGEYAGDLIETDPDSAPGQDAISDPTSRIVGYSCSTGAGSFRGWTEAVWMAPADEPGVDGEIIRAYTRDPETEQVDEVSCGDGEPDFGRADKHPSTWVVPEARGALEACVGDGGC